MCIAVTPHASIIKVRTLQYHGGEYSVQGGQRTCLTPRRYSSSIMEVHALCKVDMPHIADGLLYHVVGATVTVVCAVCKVDVPHIADG